MYLRRSCERVKVLQGEFLRGWELRLLSNAFGFLVALRRDSAACSVVRGPMKLANDSLGIMWVNRIARKEVACIDVGVMAA